MGRGYDGQQRRKGLCGAEHCRQELPGGNVQDGFQYGRTPVRRKVRPVQCAGRPDYHRKNRSKWLPGFPNGRHTGYCTARTPALLYAGAAGSAGLPAG